MKMKDAEKENKHAPGSGAGVELGTVMGAAQGIELFLSLSTSCVSATAPGPSTWSSQDTQCWFTPLCPCPALPFALVSFLLLSISFLNVQSQLKNLPRQPAFPQSSVAPITLRPLDDCPSFQSARSLWTWVVPCTPLYFPHVEPC